MNNGKIINTANWNINGIIFAKLLIPDAILSSSFEYEFKSFPLSYFEKNFDDEFRIKFKLLCK